MVAAFADEGSTIVFAGAAVLVVLILAPQDFPHKWSYVLLVVEICLGEDPSPKPC